MNCDRFFPLCEALREAFPSRLARALWKRGITIPNTLDIENPPGFIKKSLDESRLEA